MKTVDSLPDIDKLRCLIGWDEGSFKYDREVELLERLIEISKEFGAGRLRQLIDQAHDILYNPENEPVYRMYREARLAILRQEQSPN